MGKIPSISNDLQMYINSFYAELEKTFFFEQI